MYGIPWTVLNLQLVVKLVDLTTPQVNLEGRLGCAIADEHEKTAGQGYLWWLVLVSKKTGTIKGDCEIMVTEENRDEANKDWDRAA